MHFFQMVVISGIDDCQGKEAEKSLNCAHGHGRCCYMPLNVKNYKQFEGYLHLFIYYF